MNINTDITSPTNADTRSLVSFAHTIAAINDMMNTKLKSVESSANIKFLSQRRDVVASLVRHPP